MPTLLGRATESSAPMLNQAPELTTPPLWLTVPMESRPPSPLPTKTARTALMVPLEMLRVPLPPRPTLKSLLLAVLAVVGPPAQVKTPSLPFPPAAPSVTVGQG